MPKCKRCGKELTLREFERYKEGEEMEMYACETKGCSLQDKKIRFDFLTEGNV